MTREEAIEGIEVLRNLRIFDAAGLKEALDMAVSALRAQPAKLDRSRWEGCKSCKGKNSFSVRYNLQYCPVCGKPITNEAWAELAQKIGGPDEN